MGAKRDVTIGDLTTLANYELRNINSQQWKAPETLQYFIKWLEFIYYMLADFESDFVTTGSGSFTTLEGIELYDLEDEEMGDLLFPYTVWASGLKELKLADKSERMPYVIQEEQTSGSGRSQPAKYYIEGSNIGILPFPDSTEYTIKLEYVPDFVPPVDTDYIMPFQNLFNNVLLNGMMVIAKNREEGGSGVDGALMELFQEKAIGILRKRQKQSFRMVPCTRT